MALTKDESNELSRYNLRDMRIYGMITRIIEELMDEERLMNDKTTEWKSSLGFLDALPNKIE